MLLPSQSSQRSLTIEYSLKSKKTWKREPAQPAPNDFLGNGTARCGHFTCNEDSRRVRVSYSPRSLMLTIPTCCISGIMRQYIVDSQGVKRSAIEVKCSFCLNSFLKITKYISRSKTQQHFCNRKCSQQHAHLQIKVLTCAWCDREFERKLSAQRNSKSGLYFCSLTCKNKAQSINGLKAITPAHYGTGRSGYQCKVCKTPTIRRHYCKLHTISNKYEEYIKRWNCGLETGNYKDGESLHRHLRRYMFDKNNSKCKKCGWCEVNTKTGKIPLTVNHIDGDCTNSKEDNLELLCPNCHSLTHNYGALNMGSGRAQRRKILQNNMALSSKG